MHAADPPGVVQPGCGAGAQGAAPAGSMSPSRWSRPTGSPVPNADLTVGEGARHLRADEAGRIVFSVAPRDLVTVSAEGFTPVRALGSALAESSQVTLTPAVLLAGEGDDVPLP